MAREIPEVVRAAAGLAATVLDEARKLPETLPGLPVRIIGLAMQQAMKVQQQYAGLVARGDELFTGLRGEDEPGLATFDDDEPVPSSGYRESAFDRAADAPSTVHESLVDTEVEQLLEDAPGTEEILDEIAIDELVDQAPAPAETPPATETPAAPGPDETADVSTTADELTPAADESGTPVAAANGARAAGTAPIDGYDAFSIAQLRGRLRGYQLSTVQDLLAYEEATRTREPYLRMLRNRLEKLEEQAVESSPLAPRG